LRSSGTGGSLADGCPLQMLRDPIEVSFDVGVSRDDEGAI
jgi:hypothetical protein